MPESIQKHAVTLSQSHNPTTHNTLESREVKRNYGGKGSARVLEANTGVVVCTIEKANSLINRMSEERCLSSLSCVVVDELHMVRSLPNDHS